MGTPSSLADPHTIVADSALDRMTGPAILRRVDDALAAPDCGRLVLDLAAVETFDSAGVGAIVQAMRCAREGGADVRLRSVPRSMLDLLSLVHVERLLTQEMPAHTARIDPIRRVGVASMPVLLVFLDLLRCARSVLSAVCLGPWRGRRLRWDRAMHEFDHAAFGALPIVALIAFLLGLILAMQAWVQLRMWGAEIYMADMVGVSVMTEIGPLMTAIVLAARSGSSNAAQLGSMVVSEELDALKQMGVDAVRYLILPKVLALAVAVVALSILFDGIAICGGALFAFVAADIEPGAYREQTRVALSVSDFAVATVKCGVFGLCIGIVGCGLGMRTAPADGSEGVGRATTSAVVLAIFLVIIIDALFVTAQRLVIG